MKPGTKYNTVRSEESSTGSYLVQLLYFDHILIMGTTTRLWNVEPYQRESREETICVGCTVLLQALAPTSTTLTVSTQYCMCSILCWTLDSGALYATVAIE